MNNDELRDKLNELEELRKLKYFMKYSEKYKIIIKKGEYDFCGYVTEKRKIKVSKQVLLDLREKIKRRNRMVKEGIK